MSKNFEPNESFIKAQDYELKANNHFAENDVNYNCGIKSLLESISQFNESGTVINFKNISIWSFLKDEFFKGSFDDFESFIKEIENKNNLEIGFLAKKIHETKTIL